MMEIECLLENNSFNDLDETLQVEEMDIDSLFDLEEETFKNINNLEDKIKELDVIYLRYDSFKNNFREKILNEKNLLIKIRGKKEEYSYGDKDSKLVFLKKEFNILLRLSNTNYLIRRINDIIEKIDILITDYKDDSFTRRYNKIMSRYEEIVNFLSNSISNEVISSEIDIDTKIRMYQGEIKRLIKKMMIFDNYLFSLDNLYKDIVEKRMLDITVK